MKYPNARNYLASQLWAIKPDTLDTIGEVLELRAEGLTFTSEEIQARIGGGRESTATMAGAIAVIPLYGVIDQKVGSMSLISGGTAVNAFMESFRSALSDESVTSIVLDVDSPGGSVAGIQEAATEIFAARGKKRIIAVANAQIASAAYWLACAADEIVCMPSGQVGSIGIIAIHRDYSKANDTAGIKPTYVTYGQYKVERNPDAPLSDDAQSYMQGQVNQMGDMFTNFVAKSRGVSAKDVRANFGQGRMLMAKDALAAKMIDSIGTLDQTIAKLSRRSGTAMQGYAGFSDEHAMAALEAPALVNLGMNETTPLKAEASKCDCTCEEGCTCTGSNTTCCGDPDCGCCDGMTANNFSTMTEREASKQVLVGLADTLPRWGGLVDRALQSKKPGGAISKANAHQLLNLYAGISDAKTRIEALIERAGIKAQSEPNEPQVSVSIDNLLALETERLRLLEARL
jgi:signal peptide peptidase SppA